jgi:ribosomal protein S18 acetylase RimI-like enzyme
VGAQRLYEKHGFVEVGRRDELILYEMRLA